MYVCPLKSLSTRQHFNCIKCHYYAIRTRKELRCKHVNNKFGAFPQPCMSLWMAQNNTTQGCAKVFAKMFVGAFIGTYERECATTRTTPLKSKCLY